MRSKMKLYIYIAIATVLIFAVFTLLRKPAQTEAQTKNDNAALNVTETRPEQKQWPVELPASGTIVAWQEAVIGAETGGVRITALYADVGDWVKRGQVLAELSRDTVQAEIRRYEASLASAKASLSKSMADADRARLVKGSGAISEQQVNEYLVAEETARANVDLAEAQLAGQKVTLSQTRIVAVDDGLITSRSALLGQVVNSGVELFRLQRQGRLEWQAEVDAKQLAMIRAGAKAEINLPSGEALQGSVRLTSPSLSTSTSRANVFVSLPKGSAAKAGMFASGRIEAAVKTVLAVQESAVVLRDGHNYVFEIGSGSKVVRREVNLGIHRDGLVEITGGLSRQGRVVRSGGAFLSDGSLVNVVREPK
jgi:RND family efflux transporter MFP subunit